MDFEGIGAELVGKYSTVKTKNIRKDLDVFAFYKLKDLNPFRIRDL